MRVATRAFLVVAVLFWLIAASLPSAAAPEGAGPPDHGDRSRGKGDSDHDHGSHGPGSGDHGPGNRDHGPGMVSHGPGNENPGGNRNGGHEPPPPPPPSSGKGPCGAQTSDADQVAAVRAMIAEQCDCASASNPGRYMKCVAHAANAAVRDGSLRAECRDSVVHCAAMSTCGRKNAVTCCRTDEHGTTRCSVKHRAADCKAPHDGTACVGSASSCCDACGAGTCPSPGSTTTTTPSVTSTTAPESTTTTATTAPTTTTMMGSPGGAFLDP